MTEKPSLQKCMSQNHPINEWVTIIFYCNPDTSFCLPFYLGRHALSFHCCFSASSLQLILLKSIKAVLSLILTCTQVQRAPRSNKYVHVGKEFCTFLLLMHGASGSSLSPKRSLSVRPFLLIHLHRRPLQVTSKLLHLSVPSFSFIYTAAPFRWRVSYCICPSLLSHSSTQPSPSGDE